MLDAFSREFAEVLFERFPEWRDASSTRRDGQGREYLHVGLARPVENDPVGGVTISTENEEVTVACGRHWHSHFCPSSDEALSELFAFLRDVFEEELVFVRFQLGDRVLGGESVDVATAKELIVNGPPLEPFHPRLGVVADVLSLWSWRGTFDRTVKR